jgi:hypothetical protein
MAEAAPEGSLVGGGLYFASAGGPRGLFIE